jgi:hypothetical protein
VPPGIIERMFGTSGTDAAGSVSLLESWFAAPEVVEVDRGRVRPGRAATPGPMLAADLADLPLQDCSESELVEAAVATHRLVSWGQSLLLAQLAELDARLEGERAAALSLVEGCAVPEAGDELSAAAAIAPGTADRLVRLARTLTDRLPATLAALARGDLDATKAQAVATAVEGLGDAATAAVESVALTEGPGTTSRQLTPLLEAAAIAADPAGAQQRRDRARRDRHVACWPKPDGMATLGAHGTAEQVTSMFGVLDALARGPLPDGDARTLDQRRFDALHALVSGTFGPDGIVPPPEAAAGTRSGVEVQVVISADTLAGRDDHPAFLTGYGPITADAARALAADTRWRRLLTDPTGTELLEVAAASYVPPRALARYVRTRDGRCVFPSCTRPAVRCDLDHTRNWPAGHTCRCNLAPLCRRHHNAKTRRSWTLTQPEPGRFVWTSNRTGQTRAVTTHPPWRLVVRGRDAGDDPPPAASNDPPPF